MKKKLLQVLYISAITGILMFLVSGCLGLGEKPYIAVTYYDLTSPTQIALKKVQVKFLPLDSTEPTKFKMVYHDANGRMLVDDYNKWIQTPALMLTRYLQSAFKQSGITSDKCELIVGGSIFMFRIDLQKNTASLGVNYVIKTCFDDTEKVVFKNSAVFRHKFEKQAPGNFVKAMSKCAGDLIKTIQKDIEKLKEQQLTKTKK